MSGPCRTGRRAGGALQSLTSPWREVRLGVKGQRRVLKLRLKGRGGRTWVQRAGDVNLGRIASKESKGGTTEGHRGRGK